MWVKAHLWRCFAAGLTGVVARKGAEEAGAVFVRVTRARGEVRVFAPAPGPAYDDEGRRRWTEPLGPESVSEEEADRYFSRQISFDPDCWVLDIDDPKGEGLLDLTG